MGQGRTEKKGVRVDVTGTILEKAEKEGTHGKELRQGWREEPERTGR